MGSADNFNFVDDSITIFTSSFKDSVLEVFVAWKSLPYTLQFEVKDGSGEYPEDITIYVSSTGTNTYADGTTSYVLPQDMEDPAILQGWSIMPNANVVNFELGSSFVLTQEIMAQFAQYQDISSGILNLYGVKETEYSVVYII